MKIQIGFSFSSHQSLFICSFTTFAWQWLSKWQSLGTQIIIIIYSSIQIHSNCPYYLWWRIDFLVHLFRQCHRPAFEMSIRHSVAVPCIHLDCYCFHSVRPVATRPNFLFYRDARTHKTVLFCFSARQAGVWGGKERKRMNYL